MRAVRFEGNGQIALREVERPSPGALDLLIRVEACGICGTDRHIVKGEFGASPPVTLGHEFSGIVDAVGNAVTRFRVGERVTADPNHGCGLCAPCREGKVNLCLNLQPLGVRRDGGFADYALVPEAQAHGLPLSIPPLHGAFCEPLACCIHGVDLAGLKAGSSAIVLGGGVIGMLVVQLARLAGASRVVLVTRQREKRALAETLGATASVDPGDGDMIEQITGAEGLLPGGADAVFECAGVSETVEQMLKLTKRGGTAVLLGVLPPDARVAIDPLDLLLREVRLQSSFLNPFTHARAAELIASGSVKVEPLISRTIGLEEAADAIRRPALPGEIRTLVVPR
ncbi:MAG: zinc-dependent alcohol dehydrogenase family protein [Methylobacterium mesophilicum]|nr:zinc-dependent alcohol dehydrogenase family protein [Methylobacterium mesophilicum]